jgi:hypothetical protein
MTIMCRVEHLEEDFQPVLDELNRRRLPGAPLMMSNIGWHQRGPIAKQVVKQGGVSQLDAHRSRHAEKYAQCGEACLNNVNTVYQKDFEILQYPMHSVNS